MEVAAIVANVFVNFWLLIIVHQQHVRKQLPWFVSYILWECFAACVQLLLWLIGRQLYAPLYWRMEAIEIALIVAAVRESFLRIFHGFTRRPGFRWLIWSVISVVIFYSAWKAVHAPPLQASHLGAFVAGAEFLFRWGILGIWFLTTILSALLNERMDTREDAVVTGFALSAGGFLLYLGSFSIFGVRYAFITKYLASVGYFMAAGWWIWVFTRPVKEFGFKELGMGPEDIRKKVRQYREHAEQILRKKW